MTDLQRDISVVILAGGKSTRMGEDKAFIKLAERALIEYVLAVVRTLSDDIIIVTNNPEKYEPFGSRTVHDLLPRNCSLVGLYSGLRVAIHRHTLVVACDMPFLSAALINYMVNQLDHYDAVIPAYKGYYEALHAIYSQTCIPVIETHLARGNCKITDFFRHIRARYIDDGEVAQLDPEHWSFFNVNNPDDLARARLHLARSIAQIQV